MIISRTPFRVSFFGGGTDYPVWFREYGGAVLSTTIDKYIYTTTRYLPPFFKHKSRIVWSFIELVEDIEGIRHPSVRECLKFMKIAKGVEIHYDADLPSRTGLGSSSAFTVGLLNSLYALKGKMVSRMQLAKEAIYIEQKVIKENVGSQDQISTAFGGFNLIEFKRGGEFVVTPITISAERLKLLDQHLLLVFTGFSKGASDIAGRVIRNAKKKKRELRIMHQMVGEAKKILTTKNRSLLDFGKLLHEGWEIKRGLAQGVSIPIVDAIYYEARRAGAIGGKLLGAGGGGFMLIFAHPGEHAKIRKRLKKFVCVPFKYTELGSQIIFYNQEMEYKLGRDNK